MGRPILWTLAAALALPVAAQEPVALIETFAGGGGTRPPVPVVFGPSGVAVDASAAIYVAASYSDRVIKIDGRGDASTVAGTGQRGFSGDGGPAISARLDGPSDVAVSSAGDIYILDDNNFRIRKVDAATGVITTVAGTGLPGFSGDGGPARSARLGYIGRIAVDRSSNLYFADYQANRIRKVEAATGIVSTVAGTGRRGFGGDGGVATSASLFGPTDAAVDVSDNLYIAHTGAAADAGNPSIRKVDAATGHISTVVDSFELGWHPRIAVGSAGDIYVAGGTNNRLHKVDAATGGISTVAGTGVPVPGGDGGAASSASLDASDVAVDRFGNLYIAEFNNHRVRRVDATTGNISTIAAASGTYFGFSGDGAAAPAAQLYGPSGVAVDAAGNVYIADTRNQRVRKVDAATGNIATVAGTGERGRNGDGGPAVAAQLEPIDVSLDAAGNVYVADRAIGGIRKIEAGTGTISTIADRGVLADGALRVARRVAVDKHGNVFIASGSRVHRVEVATGVISIVAGTGETGFSGDGGAAALARLSSYLDGLAVDDLGNVYIADSLNFRLRKVDAATGIIWTIAGTGEQGFRGDGGLAVSARLRFPSGVAVDALRNIYIADWSNNRVRKVDSATGRIETIAGGSRGFGGDGGPATEAEFAGPLDVAVDSFGSIYIADEYNHRIRRIWVPGAATGGQRHRPVSRRLAGDSLRLPLTLILAAGDLRMPRWRASSSHPSLVTVRVYGDELLLAPEPAAEGAADIELVAMDADGRSVAVYFRVQVEFHWPIRIARGWRNAIGAMLSAGSG